MATQKLAETRIDLPAKARKAICDLLNQTLAELFDLYSQAKQAHWTVRGPNFWQLHRLLDEVADAIEEPIDEIAERIATLGGLPLGTVRAAAGSSPLSEFPAKFDDIGHVLALADRVAVAANNVRARIDQSDEQGDKSTADLFTDVSRVLDKQLWFLEAHAKRET